MRQVDRAEVARRFGVSLDKVAAWIRSGELCAINLATNARGRRPRFVVDEADLAVFEASRAAKPTTAAPRHRKVAAGVIQFF